LCIIIGISYSPGLRAQFLVPSDTLNKSRLVLATSITAVGYTSSMIALNELWYKDFPKSGFHFYNDNSSWMQIDKAGHALTSYQLGRYGYEVLRWSGVNEKSSIWIGGNLGLFFLTGVEILDGHSEEWGFSYGDMLANVGGTVLFIGQELAWGAQRASLKFSYSSSQYAQLRPETLGYGGLESVLKDYNGQTIWLSVNPSSFTANGKKTFLPWLNVAIGYGANGMLGGDFNPSFNDDGQALPDIDPYRQYYLSLDIDLTRIKTDSHLLKTLFSVVGFLKVPAPALELSEGNLKWHWLHY
jgi:hypothetical protein